MPLAPGTRIGPYEVTALLGAGGMGEVYRATDTRLNRQVAIKVLPEAVIDDPDRLARFEREARVLAALNHPHIAQVYGIEQADHLRAIVMELVDGPTLEEQIAKGPIAIADALPIARQIAEALETAHELGIIHRDLKPANVKLKGAWGLAPTRLSDGDRSPMLAAADVAGCTVKVLDFGLAKAVDHGPYSEPTSSPTVTARATELGMILGTAAYMAPEQARGRPVDRRADVWAFGVVLHEMLTGTRMFKGEDASDTLAAVLRQPILLTELPPDVPAGIRALLERCLERDPRQRLRDIGEARVALERTSTQSTTGSAGAVTVNAPAVSRARTLVPWSLLAAALIALALLLSSRMGRPSVESSAPTTRVTSALGVAGSLVVDSGPAAVLSPDGRSIVLRVRHDSATKLYLRRLDALTATEIAGSDQATNPFFSPDGSQIGFFAGGGLKTMPLSGGAIATVTDAPTGRGAAWFDNGEILFQSSLFQQTPLVRVTASGAPTDRGTTLAPDEETHRWPQILPGGQILYSANSDVANWDNGVLRVQTQHGVPGKVVLRGGYHGRYAPSGDLLYVHAGTLYAVRFDLDRLEVTSPASPIVGHLVASSLTGGAQFSLASNGTLAYVPGNPTRVDNRMYWSGADGKTSVLGTMPGAWSNPRFSSDGKLIAMQVTYGSHEQIAVYDWEADRLTAITSDASHHRYPVWSPNGRHIIYTGDVENGAQNIFRVNADGSGRPERLTTSPQHQHVFSMHPSGRYVLYADGTGTTKSILWVLPLDGSPDAVPGTPSPFPGSSEFEALSSFSPDGNLVASMASEQNQFQIQVRRFDQKGIPWRVTTNGGAHPIWSKTANELLYVEGDQLMAVRYTFDGSAFRAERPGPWTPVRHATAGPTRKYDLHPDGRRAIVANPDTTGAIAYDNVVLVFNFFDELRQRLP